MQQLAMPLNESAKKRRRLAMYTNPDVEHIGLAVVVTIEGTERVGFGKGSIGLQGTVTALSDGTEKTEWCARIRLDEPSYLIELEREKKHMTEAYRREHGVDENRELWICAGMLEKANKEGENNA